MDKRYQVFVSSTFQDLQEERQEVIQALLELDCIPAGMELFPAADEDPWALIRKVIDDCDYYMVIIAGRYGSIGPAGKSFTRMEYEYAISRNKPVIAFTHADPESLPKSKCASSEKGQKGHSEFLQLARKKVCRPWKSPKDLGSVFRSSLVQLIRKKPGIGWIRANTVPDEAAIQEILQIQKNIEQKVDQLTSDAVKKIQKALNVKVDVVRDPTTLKAYAEVWSGFMDEYWAYNPSFQGIENSPSMERAELITSVLFRGIIMS
jgi:Domain of unknown function (DUF4062)